MHKRFILASLVLFPALGLIFGFGVWSCFAEESMTITTYYPSPYGSYNELQTNKFAVGDTNGDFQLSSADQPPANGQIYAARSIILKPQSSLPSSNLLTGELAYSNSKLYSYDGSAWAAVGGSASSGVTMISAQSASTYSHYNAPKYCYNLSAAAAVAMNGDTTTVYTDWRLPSMEEVLVFVNTLTVSDALHTGTASGITVNNYVLVGGLYGDWAEVGYTGSAYVRCVR